MARRAIMLRHRQTGRQDVGMWVVLIRLISVDRISYSALTPWVGQQTSLELREGQSSDLLATVIELDREACLACTDDLAAPAVALTDTT